MIKILCCEHFITKLDGANINFVKKKDFFCDCDEHFDTFVVQCTYHKMFFKRFGEWPAKCKCNKITATETCVPYLWKMFILNYVVYKVCIPTLLFHILKKNEEP